MLNAHLNIYRGQPRHELRVDWPMRQFVERMRALVATGVDRNTLTLQMRERGVPYHVMARVLAGR